MKKQLIKLFPFLFSFILLTGCGKDDEPQVAYLTAEFAPEANLGIDLNDTYFRGSGAEFDIIVTSNTNWILNRNSKLHFEPASGQSGSTAVHVTLPKSTSKEVKPLMVEFMYGFDGYTQTEQYCMFQLPSAIISIEPDSWLTFNSNYSSADLTLITNQPCMPHFDLSDTEDWVSVEYVQGTAQETYDFGMSVKCRVTVQPNASGKIRETRFKCYTGGSEFPEEDEYSRTITITQDK